MGLHKPAASYRILLFILFFTELIRLPWRSAAAGYQVIAYGLGRTISETNLFTSGQTLDSYFLPVHVSVCILGKVPISIVFVAGLASVRRLFCLSSSQCLLCSLDSLPSSGSSLDKQPPTPANRELCGIGVAAIISGKTRVQSIPNIND